VERTPIVDGLRMPSRPGGLLLSAAMTGVARVCLVALRRRTVPSCVRHGDPPAAVAATDAHLAEVADTPLVRGADAA
jgi:hypothetical protein